MKWVNTNYKTTIAGSFSALGKTLMGVGIIPQLAHAPSQMLTNMAVAGFICDAIGTFLGHLFAADAKSMANLKEAVSINTESLRTGDTSLLGKADSLNPVKNDEQKEIK